MASMLLKLALRERTLIAPTRSMSTLDARPTELLNLCSLPLDAPSPICTTDGLLGQCTSQSGRVARAAEDGGRAERGADHDHPHHRCAGARAAAAAALSRARVRPTLQARSGPRVRDVRTSYGYGGGATRRVLPLRPGGACFFLRCCCRSEVFTARAPPCTPLLCGGICMRDG